MADGGIGSVSVSVVPDATGFVERFVAQTRAGVVRAGEEDGAAYGRAFQHGAGNIRLRPDVDTTRARAQLAALNQEGRRSSSSLVQVLTTLAPALVPLSGAAATAGAGLTALGAAGVLAIKGIQAELKNGTNLGDQYAASINVAKDALATLEHTASQGVLGGFQESVGKLAGQLPAFNNVVAESSRLLGDIGSHLAGGLVAGFSTFEPVLLTAEQALDKLSARFEQFASTADGAKFGQSLVDDFHDVVPLIVNLSTALGRLIAAAAPVGGALVSSINELAQAINAIPLPVLTGLVTAFTALSTARLASNALGLVATNLTRVAAGSSGAARNIGLLGAGLGRVVPYVAAIAAANVGFKAADNATRSWATSANSLQYAVAQTAHTFSDLFSGKFSSAASDVFGQNRKNAENYRTSVLQAQQAIASLVPTAHKAGDAFGELNDRAAKLTLNSRNIVRLNGDAAKTGAIAGQAIGNASGPTNGQLIAAQFLKTYQRNLEALRESQTNFNTTLAKAPLSQASAAYTQQATALDKVVSGQKRYLTSGDDSKRMLSGLEIGTNAVSDATARFGGNSAKAIGYLRAQAQSYQINKIAAEQAAKGSERLGEAVGFTAAKYKLTTDQVDLYAQVAGVSAQRVASGAVSQRQFAAAVGQVASAVSNASTSTADYVAAIATFNKSANTAADRGALIGATLKAANGPLLAYANTMVATATANKQLTSDFKATSRSVLNLKKGTIDYHKAAAAPLLNDLSNLQNSAVQSAAATYQYEQSQHKASAAADAFKVYVQNTRGALEQSAQQIGLTKGQADKLATSYFGIKNSGDLKKQIALIGDNQVLSALHSILSDLDILAGKHPRPSVQLTGAQQAIANARAVQSALDGLHGVTVAATVANLANSSQHGHSAAGSRSWTADGKLPAGYSTVGERGWELVKTDAAGRSEVFSHNQSMAMTGMPNVLPGFAAGTSKVDRNLAALASLLRSLGATKAGIAGFEGNTLIESGGRTTAYNPRENAYGLQQFEGGRLQHLERIARRQGTGVTSLSAQLALIKSELTHGYGDTLQVLRHASSARQAAAYVDAHYERSSGDARQARENAAARLLRHGLKFSGAAAAGGAAVGGGSGVGGNGKGSFVVAGQQYDTPAKALAAAQKSLKGQLNLGVKIRRGDLNGVRKALRGTASDVASAFQTTFTDLRTLGLDRNSGIARRLRVENVQIQRQVNVRNRDAARLASYNQKFRDLSASIKSAVTGSFDITGAGTGFDGNQAVSGASILAQSKQAEAKVKLFVKDINGLRGKINNTYLSQLAQAGPSALPQVEALTKLSKGQLATLNKEQVSIASLGAGLGQSVGRVEYGTQIGQFTRQVRDDNRKLTREFTGLRRDVAHLSSVLEHRPVIIKQNGREVGRAASAGNRKNARRR